MREVSILNDRWSYQQYNGWVCRWGKLFSNKTVGYKPRTKQKSWDSRSINISKHTVLFKLFINFNKTNSVTISQCFLFLSLIFHTHPCTKTQQRTTNPAIREVSIFKSADLLRLFIQFNKNNYVTISPSLRFILTLTLSKSMHYKPRTKQKWGVYTQKLDRTKGFWTPHPPSRKGGVGEKIEKHIGLVQVSDAVSRVVI